MLTIAWLVAANLALVQGPSVSIGVEPMNPSNNAVQTPKDSKKKSDSSVDRLRSKNNLKQLSLAHLNYMSTHGRYPAPAIYSADGKPLLSWRVALLPYLEEEQLYKQFKLDEPWDSEHNKKLLAKMPVLYAPVGGDAKEPHSTFYQVFVGKDTVFEGGAVKVRISAITDGSSRTATIVEAGEAVPWTKPADLAYDEKKPLPTLGGMFVGGFHMAMADGSVLQINEKFDEMMMRRVITKSDDKEVDLKSLTK